MIAITVIPNTVLIEKDEMAQYLNFDFLLDNPDADKLQIYAIRCRVFDGAHRLLQRKTVGLNGISPSLLTLGKTEIEGHGQLYIFNPFHTFAAGLEIEQLEYEFVFLTEDGQVTTVHVHVAPTLYQPKTELYLPLKSRLIVYDGHDFYSHHRRVDLTHPVGRQLGIIANGIRYAFDFCLVNDDGEMFQAGGERTEDWFGFGAPIYAPGAGKVVRAVNTAEDYRLGETEFDYQQAFENPESMAGNFVTIDHGNGEYSGLVHLKQGSLTVQVNDIVQAGQLIGQMGFSGDAAGWVHLHYELRAGADGFSSEGLPVYFRDFRRVQGRSLVQVSQGLIDTGEIIEPGR